MLLHAELLTLKKRQAKFVADDILSFLLLFIYFFFSEKISIDISCESSAWDSHEISSLIFSERLYLVES